MQTFFFKKLVLIELDWLWVRIQIFIISCKFYWEIRMFLIIQHHFWVFIKYKIFANYLFLLFDINPILIQIGLIVWGIINLILIFLHFIIFKSYRILIYQIIIILHTVQMEFRFEILSLLIFYTVYISIN